MKKLSPIKTPHTSYFKCIDIDGENWTSKLDYWHDPNDGCTVNLFLPLWEANHVAARSDSHRVLVFILFRRAMDFSGDYLQRHPAG